MEKKDALIIQILAHASTKDAAKNRIMAPEELDESVRKIFRETEEELRAIPVPAAVMRGRGYQKMMTWNPDTGLMVHDTGPSGSCPHWSEESCQMLLTVLPLIPQLLDKAHQNNTRYRSNNMSAGAEAVFSGVALDLIPPPKPETRPLSKEEDMPTISPVVEDEEEHLLEELEEEVDSEAREILGTDAQVEEPVEPTVLPDISDFVPPAKRRKGKSST